MEDLALLFTGQVVQVTDAEWINVFKVLNCRLESRSWSL
jgi:hypothetical protein